MKQSSKLLFGTILAAGILGGSITAFAATSSSNNSTSNHTTASSQTAPSNSGMPGFRGGPGGPGGPGWRSAGGPHGFLDLSVATSTIGVSEATLQSDLQAGQSIASIATSKGVSEQTVVNALEKNNQTRLDALVSSGKLTSQQEQTMVTNFNSHVKQMVEQTGGFHRGPGWRGAGGPHGFLDLSVAASTIGVSEATLQSDLQAGQSIASIAQGKGVSEQTVINALEKSNQTRLDALVSSSKLTSQQEHIMVTNFNSHVKQLVEQKGGMGCGPRGDFGAGSPGKFGASVPSNAQSSNSSTQNSTSSNG